MPAGGSWPGQNSLLSGLFGAFQQAATQRLSTADVWQTLRTTAGTWQHQAQGGGELPSQQELEDAGRQILTAQGVGLRQVNAYRALANEWRTATERLHQVSGSDQLSSREIFVPPWAQTADSAVPARYRVRVNWEVTPPDGDVFTKWASYELGSPLTNLDDVLSQAQSAARGYIDSDQIYNAVLLDPIDYQVEQV